MLYDISYAQNWAFYTNLSKKMSFRSKLNDGIVANWKIPFGVA